MATGNQKVKTPTGWNATRGAWVKTGSTTWKAVEQIYIKTPTGWNNASGQELVQAPYPYIAQARQPSTYQNRQPSTYATQGRTPFTYQGQYRVPFTYQNPYRTPFTYQGQYRVPFTYQNPYRTPFTYQGQYRVPFTYQNPYRTPFTYQNPYRVPFTYQNPYRTPFTYQNPYRTPFTYNNRYPATYPANARQPATYIASYRVPYRANARYPARYVANARQPYRANARYPAIYIANARQPFTYQALYPYAGRYAAPYPYGDSPGPSGGGGCFAVGTPIWMGDNSFLPIEQVKVDDIVFGYNWEHGNLERTKVVSLMEPRVCKVYEIVANGKTIKTTGGHPFCVEKQGWKVVSMEDWHVEVESGHTHKEKDDIIGELQVGDHLIDINNGILNQDLSESGIESITELGEETVYHFTVESEHHNFYANSFLVHNLEQK